MEKYKPSKKELQNIAREFNLRGWSRMRRDALELFIYEYLFPANRNMPEAEPSPPTNQNLLDAAVPDINAPVMAPGGPNPVPRRQNLPRGAIPRYRLEQPQRIDDWFEWAQNRPPPSPMPTDDWAQWLQVEPPPPPTAIQKWLRSMRDVTRATALKGFYQELAIPGIHGETPRQFFQRVRPQIAAFMRRNPTTKTKFMLSCEMSKSNYMTGSFQEFTPVFSSRNKKNLVGTDKFEIIDEMIEEVMVNFENYQRKGSNLQFEQVVELAMPFVKFQPLGGSSYLPLPAGIRNKKSIINMKNENDEECFKWCITRKMFPVDVHPERVTETLKKQSESLNWSGISFPTPLNEIDKFERNNPKIAICVFGVEGELIYPLKISKKIKTSANEYKNIDLLLISQEEEGKTKTHYCLIKFLQRTLRSQVTKHMSQAYFCRNCLNHFTNQDILLKHEKICFDFKEARIDVPEKGTDKSLMKFKNYNRKMEFPFVIYADFEARLKPFETVFPDPKESYTEKIQEHVLVSFCFHLVSPFMQKKPVIYRAENDERHRDFKQIR